LGLSTPELVGRDLDDAEAVGLFPCRGHLIFSVFRREILVVRSPRLRYPRSSGPGPFDTVLRIRSARSPRNTC
jgi:hypothetical protein